MPLALCLSAGDQQQNSFLVRFWDKKNLSKRFPGSMRAAYTVVVSWERTSCLLLQRCRGSVKFSVLLSVGSRNPEVHWDMYRPRRIKSSCRTKTKKTACRDSDMWHKIGNSAWFLPLRLQSIQFSSSFSFGCLSWGHVLAEKSPGGCLKTDPSQLCCKHSDIFRTWDVLGVIRRGQNQAKTPWHLSTLEHSRNWNTTHQWWPASMGTNKKWKK